jgi:hypothetical protein
VNGSGSRRTLFISFDTSEERDKWAKVIKRAVFGEWQMFLQESKAGTRSSVAGLGLSSRVDAHNAARMTKADEKKLGKLITKKSNGTRSLWDAMAQLKQLNDLLENSEITTTSYETLLGTLINGMCGCLFEYVG